MINETVKKRASKEISNTQLLDHRGRFIDLDTNGRVIENRSKDKRSKEIEGDSRFCGKRFAIEGHLEGEKRCMYCGSWFVWSETKTEEYIAKQNIDPYNVDNNMEPVHCGKTACDGYHNDYIAACIRRQAIEDEKEQQRGLELLKKLKGQGIL